MQPSRFLDGHDLAVVIGGDAAHAVMHGRYHRDRFLGNVHPGEDARGLGNTRQHFMDHLRSQVFEVQMDVILLQADATPLQDLHRHGTAHHIAGSQVLGVGGVALHEALAFGIGEISAFAAHAFGDQHASTINAGRMELDELHVLQRQAGASCHGVAVARLHMRTGA